MIEPLHLDLELRCDAEHAFAVWTERTSTWWPVSHSVSGADGERWRDANQGGWAGLLPHFVAAAEA